MKDIVIGSQFTAQCEVTLALTAQSMGSGDMEVFATPSMIALMESAAMQCLSQFIDTEDSSVGISVNSTHIKATPLGATVQAIATITAVDGRKVSFEIEAKDNEGMIGRATHDRFVVNREKFISKLK